MAMSLKRAALRMGRIAACAVLIAICSVALGCGALTARPADFPNAETGEDGQIYLLDDLRDIANDPDMTADQKRQAFMDLGIQDEDLIDSLLTLPAN